VPLLCFSLAGAPSPSGIGAVSEIAAMHIARASHTSTLLPNGKVLIAGGIAGSGGAYSPYRTAELYDQHSGTFQSVAEMSIGRSGHTATLLKNGKVLIVGGWTGRYDPRGSAEIFDPAANTFTPTGNLVTERAGNTATLLADRRVLIAGGEDRQENKIASAEIYDPASSTFAATGTMNTARFKLPATVALLSNGRVLVAGGGPFAELYDETTGSFTKVPGSLGAARFFASATLLPGGKALITGGYAESGGSLPATPASWLYQP
jgi:hypothetical protein